MQRVRRILEALVRPAWLPVYLAGLTLILGWASNRGYLRYFGISPTGLDNTSAETYVNFFGYGLRAYTEYWVGFAFFISLAFVFGWLILPGAIKWIFFKKSENWHQLVENLWTLVSLVLVIIGLPLS